MTNPYDGGLDDELDYIECPECGAEQEKSSQCVECGAAMNDGTEPEDDEPTEDELEERRQEKRRRR